MKTYVLTVSKNFPANHPKSGHPTEFPDKILNGRKRHTIRKNYDLWAKRFEQINAGNAILSIRYWSGKPYRSKQVEIKQLTKDDGIGIEMLKSCDELYGLVASSKTVAVGAPWPLIAIYDGLTLDDFEEWFNINDFEPMAIIHFTPYRYNTPC